ncbi:MAG: hypothetical protein DI537_27405 [Stutzerimonas stutzeri]|nr:MAG: hypothetical protein DI537_27405 [Stutzerimonas stutzeri]
MRAFLVERLAMLGGEQSEFLTRGGQLPHISGGLLPLLERLGVHSRRQLLELFDVVVRTTQLHRPCLQFTLRLRKLIRQRRMLRTLAIHGLAMLRRGCDQFVARGCGLPRLGGGLILRPSQRLFAPGSVVPQLRSQGCDRASGLVQLRRRSCRLRLGRGSAGVRFGMPPRWRRRGGDRGFAG